MFGKRTDAPPTEQKARPPAKPQPVTKPSAPKTPEANPEARTAAKPKAAPPKKKAPETVTKIDDRSDEYYRVKTMVFNALIDTIDLAQLAQLDADSAREEIRDIVVEIISIKNVVMSISEQEQLLDDICNDVLGYGPLEPLLQLVSI